jgi:hypothetical protein
VAALPSNRSFFNRGTDNNRFNLWQYQPKVVAGGTAKPLIELGTATY